MSATVALFSNKNNEIHNFLSKFYDSNISIKNPLSWQKKFDNPIEISEIVAAFVDNINFFNLNMWVSLDKNVFIKVSPSNANHVIKYLFERYPY